MSKLLKRTFLVVLYSMVVAGLAAQPIMAQRASELLDFGDIDNTMYEPKSGICGTGTQTGGSKLDGYTLPADTGRTGKEGEIDPNGFVPELGGYVTFSHHIKKLSEDPKKKDLVKKYQDYYITMRWNYATWNWNGTTGTIDNKEYQWMADKPRLLLVSNGNKSLIMVALEAGPQPWAGVDTSDNNDPKQGWKNPQKGTPENYTGRVSGMTDKAMKELGAEQGMSGGKGTVLNYTWAPDQNAEPGPSAGSASSGAGANAACGATDNSGAFVTSDGYAMVLGLPKKEISNGYGWPCESICHHDETGAFDLAHKDTVPSMTKDELTAGRPVFAIYKGKVRIVEPYTYDGVSPKGCFDIHFQADDGYHYWYGHLGKVDVQAGQQVTAGQKLSIVGLRPCTVNGSYPHVHIDRGFPKGNTARKLPDRDSRPASDKDGFVALMNRIYKSMP